MTIDFIPLAEWHFPLLLKWLEMPHVKAWWSPQMKWTPELIHDKYTTYVKGYKYDDGSPKPIHAYIITVNEEPIGYIQCYNAYDFPRRNPLIDLPESLGAFDMFIGEKAFLGQGLGSQALQRFLETYSDPQFTHAFADPDRDNLSAIRTYERAGFHIVKENPETPEIWMVRESVKRTET